MRENLLNPRFTKAEDKIGLMIRECIRPGQMIETEDMTQTIVQDRIIEVIDSENILEEIVGRILGKGIEVREIIINDRIRDRNRSRDRNFTGSYGRNRSSDSSRSRSGSRTNTNRDRIRCYVCREYDHFARDCPNSREERDLEHLQHMLNMEEQEHRDPSVHSSDKDSRSPLNLWMVGMMPPHSYH